MPKDAPLNSGALSEAAQVGPRQRVSEMQAELHRWAVADPDRRFDDLFNFVHDPATLMVAFNRVVGNRGANTPGIDGLSAADVEERVGVPGFLDDLGVQLRLGTFRPLPVRECKIPKPGRGLDPESMTAMRCRASTAGTSKSRSTRRRTSSRSAAASDPQDAAVGDQNPAAIESSYPFHLGELSRSVVSRCRSGRMSA